MSARMRSMMLFAAALFSASCDDEELLQPSDPQLAFTTTELASGVMLQPYRAEVHLAETSAPAIDWSITGALPAGLALEPHRSFAALPVLRLKRACSRSG